jgi:lipopolysaccharide transport system permease protein
MMSTSDVPSARTWQSERTKTRSYLSPVALVREIHAHRRLINQFSWRDVVARYKGSYFGIAWSFVVPLIMLAVYGFVFSVVFEAKWGINDESRLDFALTLYCGLLAFNIFAEVVGRAPTLVVANPSYVKKVVFPLEILPVAALGSALFNTAVWLVILIPTWAVANHMVSPTLWMLPIALLPLCLLSVGLGWLIASLGVFIRDIAHPVGILIQVLLFMSGVFFAVDRLPATFQKILLLNPLVTILDNVRRTTLWGEPIHWRSWTIATVGSAIVFQLGYAWLMRTKKAFADVI